MYRTEQMLSIRKFTGRALKTISVIDKRSLSAKKASLVCDKDTVDGMDILSYYRDPIMSDIISRIESSKTNKGFVCAIKDLERYYYKLLDELGGF